MAKAKLMSHADRRRLIERPMPAIRSLQTSGKSWGGTYIADSLPTEGRRIFAFSTEDEEFYAKHGRD